MVRIKETQDNQRQQGCAVNWNLQTLLVGTVQWYSQQENSQGNSLNG